MSSVRYEYWAVDQSGKRRRGSISVGDRSEVYRILAGQGLVPVKIRKGGSWRRVRSPKRLTSEVTQFTRELAVLLDAGVPIVDGVMGIAEQCPDARVRAAGIQIASDIQAGSSISGAMDGQGHIFGEVYVETVRAAERTGNMVVILESLADMLETQEEFRREIKRALTYPALVLMTLVFAVGFLLAFVIPKFAALFAQRGVELPLLTRMLMFIGVTIRDQWWVIGIALFGAIMLWRLAAARPQARLMLDRLMHRIPHLKQVMVGSAVARFCRVFGLCIGSGLSLVEAIDLGARATGRPLLARDAAVLSDGVRTGERLSTGLAQCSYLPTFAKRLLAVGEESAQMQRMCEIICRHYDRETRHLASTAATVIEPVLIVVLTGVVLVVALAVFVPMWNLAGLVG